mgnify:CR=1 FL=1
MKTAAEIRKARGIGIKHNADSLYKPIKRKKRVFNKLYIPKELQKDLPFKTKPKLEKTRIAGVTKAHAIPVIRESKDKKVDALFNILGHALNQRNAKRKADSTARKEKYQQQILKQQMKRKQQNKQLKKKVYANLQKEMNKDK